MVIRHDLDMASQQIMPVLFHGSNDGQSLRLWNPVILLVYILALRGVLQDLSLSLDKELLLVPILVHLCEVGGMVGSNVIKTGASISIVFNVSNVRSDLAPHTKASLTGQLM